MLDNKTIKYSVLATAMVTLLTACGGGSDSNTGDNTGGGTTPTSKSASGFAVDFYLNGATVTFDDCLDNTGKPISAITHEDGSYQADLGTCTASSLTVSGGVDTVTNKAFTGTLKVRKTSFGTDNQIVASPLSTLQNAMLPENPTAAQETAFRNLLQNLGFPADLNPNSFNPVTQGTADQLATIFLVQQVLTQIEDSLQDSGVSPAAAMSFAVNAFVEVVKNEPFKASSVGSASLTNIIAAAQTAVHNNDEYKNITIPDTISQNLTTISNSAKIFAAYTGSAADLAADLQDPNSSLKDTLEKIQEVIPGPVIVPTTPALTEFSFLNYGLRAIKNSTTSPISIKTSDLWDNNFISLQARAIPSTSSETSRVESMKLGIQIKSKLPAAQNSALRDNFYVNFYASNVTATFDKTGELKNITVPKDTNFILGTNIKVTQENISKLPADLQQKFPNMSKELFDAVSQQILENITYTTSSNYSVPVANGTFPLTGLFSFIDTQTSNHQLAEQAYQYALRQIQTDDNVEITVTVAPKTFTIPMLSASDIKKVTIVPSNSNTTFTGYSVTGNFKIVK